LSDNAVYEEGIAGDIYLFNDNTRPRLGTSYCCATRTTLLVGGTGISAGWPTFLIPFLGHPAADLRGRQGTADPPGCRLLPELQRPNTLEGGVVRHDEIRPIINTPDEPHAERLRYPRLP